MIGCHSLNIMATALKKCRLPPVSRSLRQPVNHVKLQGYNLVGHPRTWWSSLSMWLRVRQWPTHRMSACMSCAHVLGVKLPIFERLCSRSNHYSHVLFDPRCHRYGSKRKRFWQWGRCWSNGGAERHTCRCWKSVFFSLLSLYIIFRSYLSFIITAPLPSRYVRLDIYCNGSWNHWPSHYRPYPWLTSLCRVSRKSAKVDKSRRDTS